MSEDTKDIWVATAIVAAILAVILGGLLWLNATKCEAQWGSSGMAYSWKPIQGCLIQRKDGTWIPASAYRETER